MGDKIFISFASEDRKIATTICAALEGRGFKCWLANRDIAPGDNFQVAIVRAIRQSRMMLLVFTANSNGSEEMTKELALASQQKLMVVPLRVEDVAPNDAFAYEFATRQWIDFFADWEEAINQLCDRIAAALPTGSVPAAVAARAASPPIEVAAPAAPAPEPAVAPAPVVELKADVKDAQLAEPIVLKAAPRPSGGSPTEKPPFAPAGESAEADLPKAFDAAPPASRRRPVAVYAGIAAVVVLGLVAIIAGPGRRPSPGPAGQTAQTDAIRPSAPPAGPVLASMVVTPAAPPALAVAEAPSAAEVAPAREAAPVKPRRRKAAAAPTAPKPRADLPY